MISLDQLTAAARKHHAMLWAATLTGMGASWIHLAQFLGAFEELAYQWVGGLGATAVDLGILACMREIARGRHAKHARQTVVGLCIVSSVANGEHAVTSYVAAHRAAFTVPAAAVVWSDWLPFAGAWLWLIANAALVSGTLPVIVWRLSGLLDATKTKAPPADDDDDEAPTKSTTPKRTTKGNGPAILAAAKAQRAIVPVDLAKTLEVHPGTVRRTLIDAGYRKNGDGTWHLEN